MLLRAGSSSGRRPPPPNPKFLWGGPSSLLPTRKPQSPEEEGSRDRVHIIVPRKPRPPYRARTSNRTPLRERLRTGREIPRFYQNETLFVLFGSGGEVVDSRNFYIDASTHCNSRVKVSDSSFLCSTKHHPKYVFVYSAL